jgi:hypothetical protein
MNEFFNNKTFLNTLNKLPYGKDRTLDIMKEIKEKNPELTIDVFIYILYKRFNPAFLYRDTCPVRSRFSVELWNKYVFDNCKCDFDLLISYRNICF